MEDPVTKPAISASSIWMELRALMDLVLDFSFKRFVTPRLIRVLYVLSLLAATLAALTWMGSGFAHSMLYGFFTLVTGPLAFVLYVLTARVMMEIILAIFQIAEQAQRALAARDSEPK